MTNQLACGHLLHQVAVAVAEVYVDQVQQQEPLQLLPQVAVAEVEE